MGNVLRAKQERADYCSYFRITKINWDGNLSPRPTRSNIPHRNEDAKTEFKRRSSIELSECQLSSRAGAVEKRWGGFKLAPETSRAILLLLAGQNSVFTQQNLALFVYVSFHLSPFQFFFSSTIEIDVRHKFPQSSPGCTAVSGELYEIFSVP